MNNDFTQSNFTYYYYSKITRRLKKVIERQGLSQKEIVERCASMGVKMTQGALSKLLNYEALYDVQSKQRNTNLSLAHIVCICKVLSLDLSAILDLDLENMELDALLDAPVRGESGHKAVRQSLVSNPDEYEFTGYVGEYKTYFYPTISGENKILTGVLSLKRNDGNDSCSARLELDTNQKDRTGKPIIKKYYGRFLISPHQRAGYCILRNDKLGEINMLVLSHQQFNNQELMCKLAACITTSAGGNQRPTLHRVLISRHALNAQELETIKPQLLLNTDEIQIETSVYEAIQDQLPQAVQDLVAKMVKPRSFYCINESMIVNTVDGQREKAEAICLLREHSTAPRYNKVGTKADELVYKYLYQSQGEDMAKI